MKTKNSLTLALGLTLGAAIGAPALAQSTPNVTIAVMTDVGGPYANIGGHSALDAANMAIADYKAKGGKLKPNVLFADERGSRGAAAAKARELIEVEGATMITGLISSGSAAGVFAEGAKHRVPTFAASASSTSLIQTECSPYGIQYQNTYALAKGTIEPLIAQGKKRWFIVYAAYNFGEAFKNDATQIIEKAGGKVVGSISHPFPSSNLAEQIAAAKASGADAIGVANAGLDTTNFVRQAGAARLGADGRQVVVPFALYLQDVHALGLATVSGMYATSSFNWQQNAQSNAFSRRYYERSKRMPDIGQSSTYSSILTYLTAVEAIGSTDGDRVMSQMRSMTINDDVIQNGRIRADGLVVHDMTLVQLKSPLESKHAWDYFKPIKTLRAQEVAMPLDQSVCPFVKRGPSSK